MLDAYRYLDTLTDPELAEFLTGADVDLYGAWAGLRGLPAAPTARSRCTGTRTPSTSPPCSTASGTPCTRSSRDLPRFSLAEGEILAVDNYRCWHGRDPHTGDRLVRILTLRTAAAR